MESKFVENLKLFMKESNLNQSQLAKSLNIKQGVVSNWIKGVNLPSVMSMWKLADFFNTSIDVLVGRTAY